MEQKLENGYKADLVINTQCKTTVIEVKALLTYNDTAIFPAVTMERATRQLFQIKELLLQGQEIYYWLVLLNPKSKNVIFNKEESEFVATFQECVRLGMKLMVSNVVWSKSKGFTIECAGALDVNLSSVPEY